MNLRLTINDDDHLILDIDGQTWDMSHSAGCRWDGTLLFEEEEPDPSRDQVLQAERLVELDESDYFEARCYARNQIEAAEKAIASAVAWNAAIEGEEWVFHHLPNRVVPDRESSDGFRSGGGSSIHDLSHWSHPRYGYREGGLACKPQPVPVPEMPDEADLVQRSLAGKRRNRALGLLRALAWLRENWNDVPVDAQKMVEQHPLF